MIDLTKNTGLLIGDRPEDYRFGSTSPIVHEVRNSTKDWRAFRSKEERQNQNPEDRMHCVSASATNLLEQQANWMLANNLWPADALKFWDKGYIVDRKFEFSRRFTAKMSGTTRAGNYFYKVWDSIRKDGIVPDSMYPDDPSLTWDEYYKNPGEELKLLGKDSLKYFSVLYEQFTGSTGAQKKTALEMAPLQFGVTTQCGWDAEVPVCGLNANHAVDNDFIRGDLSYEIFDSYMPYQKHLPKNYSIPICYRAILYPITRNVPVGPTSPANVLFPIDMKYGETSLYVKDLQRVLKVIEPTTGFYGKLTQAAVWKFQKDNGLGNFFEFLFWRGRRCDKGTRDKLNKLYTI